MSHDARSYREGFDAGRAEARDEIERLREDSLQLRAAVLELNRDVERVEMLRLGALAILVRSGVISSGRARELGGMNIAEQRAFLRAALEEGEG